MKISREDKAVLIFGVILVGLFLGSWKLFSTVTHDIAVSEAHTAKVEALALAQCTNHMQSARTASESLRVFFTHPDSLESDLCIDIYRPHPTIHFNP